MYVWISELSVHSLHKVFGVLYINTVIYYIVSFVFVVQGVKPKAFFMLGRQLTTEMHP